MPPKKKEIKLRLYAPKEEQREEFQQQVNEVYMEMIRNHVNALKLEKEQKKKLISGIKKTIQEKEAAVKSDVTK